MPSENKVAVFFDYENIVYSLKNRFEQKANFEALINKCKEAGTIVEARAFADWGLPYMSSALLYALQSSGFDLIFVPTGSTQSNAPRKNVADLYMAIHVMNVLHTRPDVDTYVLLTGDRDFMSLVNVLKRNGKRVVAIGVDGSSSYYLTQAVDEFFYYSEVEEGYEERPKRLKGRLTNIYDALVQALTILNERNKPARLTHIKQVMIDLMDGFDEKQYADSKGNNFNRFKDFIFEAKRRGIVSTSSRSGVLEVFLNDKPVKKKRSAKPAPKQDEEDIPVQLGLQAAYKLLAQAVQLAQTEGKSFRASSIKSLMTRLHAGFNEGEIRNGNGKSFSRFSDFVRAAEKEGFVQLGGTGVKLEIRPIPSQETPENKDGEADEAQAEETEQATEAVEEKVEQSGEPISAESDREWVIAGLNAYKNYPTSFLSLAGHIERWCGANGHEFDDNDIRELLTAAVKMDLLQQSRRPDGRRQYSLVDDAGLVSKFTGKEIEEVDEVEAVEETEEAETPETEEAPAESAENLNGAAPSTQEEAKAPTTAVDFNSFARVSDDELRQMVVEALQSFENYPAPFMGILAHCRKLRDEKQLYVANSPLRDFLSETSKVGLLVAATEKEVRPTLYKYEANSELEGQYVTQTYPEVEAETPEAEAPAEEAEKVVEEAPAKKEVKVPAAKAKNTGPDQAILDYETRKLIAEALKTFDDYPAEFKPLFAHCCSARDAQGLSTSNRMLRTLLTAATRKSVLETTTLRGIRPILYALSEKEDALTAYVGEAPSAPEPEAVEEPAEVVETPKVEPAEEPVVETAAAEPVEAEAPASEKIVDDVPTIYDVLVQAVGQLLAEDRLTVYRNCRRRMQDILGGFDEKQHIGPDGNSFKRFKDFVVAAEEMGVVEISKSGRSERVMLPSSAESAETEAPAPNPADEEEDFAPGFSEENIEALKLLLTAVEQADMAGTSHRIRAIGSRVSKLNSDFDYKQLMTMEGKPIKKLGDFMREMAKSGRLKVTGKGISLEVHMA